MSLTRTQKTPTSWEKRDALPTWSASTTNASERSTWGSTLLFGWFEYTRGHASSTGRHTTWLPRLRGSETPCAECEGRLYPWWVTTPPARSLSLNVAIEVTLPPDFCVCREWRSVVQQRREPADEGSSDRNGPRDRRGTAGWQRRTQTPGVSALGIRRVGVTCVATSVAPQTRQS